LGIIRNAIYYGFVFKKVFANEDLWKGNKTDKIKICTIIFTITNIVEISYTLYILPHICIPYIYSSKNEESFFIIFIFNLLLYTKV
jgi:hypothetical protein